MAMDAQELARWTRFAAKGGIGKCTASRDCVAQNPEDLMFLQDDEIIVLMQVVSPLSENIYLGFCEGVVGKFSGQDVQFHGKLKKPVFTRRPGSVTGNSSTTANPSNLGSNSYNTTPSPALSNGRPLASSPTPSDAPFHLDQFDHDSEQQHQREGDGAGPSEHDTATAVTASATSHGHGYSSRSNTRASSRSGPDKSPGGSDSSSIETPLRPSEDHQYRPKSQSPSPLAIEVVDETGRLMQPPLPNGQPHSVRALSPRGAFGKEDTKPGPGETSLSLRHPPTRSNDTDGPSPAHNGRGSEPSHARNGEISPTAATSAAAYALEETVPTRSSGEGQEGANTRVPPPPSQGSDELYSPSSEYTREGGLASEDSHIQRSSTMTVSDAGFGIGLSLIQGLANGDRESKNWSESDTDAEASFARQRLRQSVPALPQGAASRQASSRDRNSSAIVRQQRASAMSVGSSSSAPGSAQKPTPSEGDDGETGFQWDDDNFLDDYRYSRYSLASKASKQSRSSTVPSVQAFSQVPPLPDDARPSLEGQLSVRSTSSPQPFEKVQGQSPANLQAPMPLKIVKNSSRDATQSPTTPVPAGSRRQGSHDDELSSGKLQPYNPDDLTPKPSTENLNLKTTSLDNLAPSTSNDYNGDESELDDASVEEADATLLSAGLFSPTSTTGSTSSIFLPHPGAPKPLINNDGQIASRPAAIHIANAAAASNPHSQFLADSPSLSDPSSPPHDSLQSSTRPVAAQAAIPMTMSLLSTLAMAAVRARNTKHTTVYASTQVDLLSSPGPVPIAFSVDGHPPSPRMTHDSELGLPRPSPASRPTPSSPIGGTFGPSEVDGKTSPAPIPRANFFPNTGRPRPRSRSFSGFSVNDAEVLIPIASREEGSQPIRGPDMASYRSSLRGGSPGPTGRSPVPSGQAKSKSPSRGSARNQRPAHGPSPLSLPAINNPNTPDAGAATLPNPRASSPQRPGSSPGSAQVGPNSLKKRGLRQVSSSGGLRQGSGPLGERLNSPPELVIQTSNDRREMSSQKPSPPRRSMSNAVPATSFDEVERPDMIASPSSVTSPNAVSSPLGRSGSLRARISLSVLRTKSGGSRPSRDSSEAPFSALPAVRGPGNEDEARVQIKDMEFELIKPMVKTSNIRASEDGGSVVTSPETESILSGLDGQSGWRADSPSISPSRSHIRSPNVKSSSVDSLSNFRSASAIQVASIEAHRVREQKWMSLISSTPSSQARKSKKIKKLLLEGVPASVRGRVWGHITDSKARRMEGLFAQLIKKAPQHLVPMIHQDIERCFPDQPHLKDPRGSLANLLLAYTAMVPDIRYRNGLTRIAGHLLLQAPDEDAFWIFVSVMDSHLRGYYHATATGQFEIDSSLFQALLESAEPELAQILFNDAGLRPVDICGTWFSCLFAGVLPPDHLYRVWDMLFYEGPIYLFRVALALITLCKRPLMHIDFSQHGREAVIDLLARPPMSAIPQDPDSFISHTFTVKMRDEDLRKQRLKRETQWKKDRLAQR